MKSNVLFFARSSVVHLCIFALIFAVTLGAIPTKSFAIDLSEVLNEDFENIEIIKFTDEEVVYKVWENGDAFLYEEHIENDTVTTKKYKVNNTSKELVEHFSTLTELKEENVSVTQKDLLSNTIISVTTVELLPNDPPPIVTLPIEPIRQFGDDHLVSINSTGTWVTSRSGGMKYSYYKYRNGGGKAREIFMEKTVSSYNQNFDQFTRNVDKIRNFERGILKDLLFIGLLDKAFKAIKSPTIANITSFLKKYSKSLPGLAVIIAFVDYMMLTNRTMDSYKKIPGIERNWRFG